MHRLVSRLHRDSPEFAEPWDRHEVLEGSCGTELLHHPALGNLSFTRTTLDFTSRLALRLTVVIPVSGTGAEEALESLTCSPREKHLFLRNGRTAPPVPLLRRRGRGRSPPHMPAPPVRRSDGPPPPAPSTRAITVPLPTCP
ncbi:hypothetical protein FOF52_17075 [Thermobifida alba]|uniref:MmyB-like transcription regulator ligand binding domain-containing protein n=1 Tax=Thermobifida alba TaxID=53522 RepID=A0ABY4L7C8_THEAE|nr:hypothetical protein FOF52_17075 [Thermobifida alba]